jgi:alpha-tubulin suppressor-like RCC1 family protein
MTPSRLLRRDFLSSLLKGAIGISVWPRLARAAGLYNLGAFWRAPQQTGYSLWAWGSNFWGELGQGGSFGQYSYSPVQIPGRWLQATGGTGGGGGSIVAGFVLAIQNNGTLWGWGRNCSGNLGQGNYVDYYSPVQIAGSWTQITAGGKSFGGYWNYFYPTNPFSLGIHTDGTLWAWGDNTYGQLGQGNLTTYNSPVQIAGSWTQVAAGSDFWSGLQIDGSLWSCGNNTSPQYWGQLGTGDNTSHSTPVNVSGGKSWIQVSAGGDSIDAFMMAIRSDHSLWVAGGNAGLTKVTGSWVQAAGGGSQMLAIKTTGGLFGWGGNSAGEVGNGTTSSEASPVSVQNGTSWIQIAGGLCFYQGYYEAGVSAGIRVNGTLWTWGSDQGSGGNNASTPQQVGGSWTQVAVGSNFLVGIKTGGTLWAWGDNSYGINGNGTAIGPLNTWTGASSASPSQIPGSWSMVAAGGGSCPSPNFNFALAIRSDSTLWGWGTNYYGELAQASFGTYISPVQIAGSWLQVSGGGTGAHPFALGITRDGRLWSWGDNSCGQLGINSSNDQSSPVQIHGSWSQVSSGGYNACAITTDGRLWTWGGGGSGEMGQNNTTSYSSPVQVSGSWTQVSAGYDPGGYGAQILAIRSNGTLWGWGANSGGELGTNSTTYFSSPVQIGGSWSQLSTSNENHTLAIAANGTLWAWGYNGSGQLGVGNTTSYSSPVMVSSSSWSQIGTGPGYSYAVRSDGTLWGWGQTSSDWYIYYGQLGMGSNGPYSSPVQMSGTWYKAIGAGDYSVSGFGLGLRIS